MACDLPDKPWPWGPGATKRVLYHRMMSFPATPTTTLDMEHPTKGWWRKDGDGGGSFNNLINKKDLRYIGLLRESFLGLEFHVGWDTYILAKGSIILRVIRTQMV